MSDEQDAGGGISRRDFMRNAAGVTAGAAIGAGALKTAQASPLAVKSILPQTVIGANERVLTGHIGIGGMGRANLGFVLRRNDMQPIALCDLWYRNRDRAKAMASQKFEDFSMHHDFREVIDNKDVDAVVISTPDHWHTLCALYAADAGKAIFCEKPLSTTIEEGNVLEKKIQETGVVFQGGTMQRSGTHFQEAVELIREGAVGKVARIETYIHDNLPLDGIGMGDDEMPDQADWEFHQGWVEHRPFNTNRWIYHFRWFLEYSGGKITDWGAHLIDIGLWAMGEEKQPKSVTCAGNKYLMQDNRTTPDTLDVLWEYDDFVLSFSNRVYNQFLPEGFPDHGTLFHGTTGTMRVDRSGYEIYPVPNNPGAEALKRPGTQLNEPHWENFVRSIRGQEKPIVSVEALNNTSRVCHIGTCAYVAGAKLQWDHENQRFAGGDAEAVERANQWAYRPYLNGWSLKAPYWIG